MEPWYKAGTPRKEVREGRSFNPDEFAIHLEQVIAKTAPEDYREPKQFFARTCFTRALQEHAGMVLRWRRGVPPTIAWHGTERPPSQACQWPNTVDRR